MSEKILQFTMVKQAILKVRLLCMIALSLSASIAASAQMPAACTTPPPPFKAGGELYALGSECSTVANPNVNYKVRNVPTPIPGTFNGVEYIFGFTDSTDINTAPRVTATIDAGIFKASQILTPGRHWIMQIGDYGGTPYVSCRQVGVFPTITPVADIFTCDGTSVTIEIKNDDKNKHDGYFIDWGDNSPIEKVLVSTNPLPIQLKHPYSGVLKQVSIKGYNTINGLNVCETFPIVKNPYDAVKPFIQKIGYNNGKVTLSFDNYEADTEYTVEAAIDNGGNYTWNKIGVAKNGTFSYTGLTKGQSYCFRLALADPCGNFTYSETTCDIALTATQPSSTQASLNWNLPTSPGGIPATVTLTRVDKTCATCITDLPLTSNRDINYLDENLECGKIYCYILKTTYKVLVDGVTETITINSDSLLVDPLAAATKSVPNGILNVSFKDREEDIIELAITEDDENIQGYTFFRRAPEDESFTQLGTSIGERFEDIDVHQEKGRYCYKYSFEDACGLESDLSPEFCTIFLDHEESELGWTEFKLPENILTKGSTKYYVQVYDPVLSKITTVYQTTDLTQTVYKILYESKTPTVIFRINASQELDNTQYSVYEIPSYSNFVEIPAPAHLYLPSAFTPNGDGNNEFYTVNSRFIDNGSITIYDRWGSVIFEGDVTGIGWDGKDATKSNYVPAGAYVFKVEGTSIAGEKISRNGTVTVIR